MPFCGAAQPSVACLLSGAPIHRLNIPRPSPLPLPLKRAVESAPNQVTVVGCWTSPSCLRFVFSSLRASSWAVLPTRGTLGAADCFAKSTRGHLGMSCNTNQCSRSGLCKGARRLTQLAVVLCAAQTSFARTWRYISQFRGGRTHVLLNHGICSHG